MKSVLITGGARGIGMAMVELFCSRGYLVAFTYKKSEALARELSERTGALAIKADSENPLEIESAVAKTLGAFGKIDCLINNAAVSSFSLFTEISLDEWRRTMAVNLDAPFLYSRLCAENMIKNGGGSIINISSMWGIVGSSCEVHYSTSKAALIGMTKALAKELGPSGVRVNAIAPGLIDTDMNSALSKQDILEICDNTPLMRMGSPLEIAEI